jgi:hypothetical protein
MGSFSHQETKNPYTYLKKFWINLSLPSTAVNHCLAVHRSGRVKVQMSHEQQQMPWDCKSVTLMQTPEIITVKFST